MTRDATQGDSKPHHFREVLVLVPERRPSVEDAILLSGLAAIGLAPKLMLVDSGRAEEEFSAAVRTHAPDAVFAVDQGESRELLARAFQLLRAQVASPCFITGDLSRRDPPGRNLWPEVQLLDADPVVALRNLFPDATRPVPLDVAAIWPGGGLLPPHSLSLCPESGVLPVLAERADPNLLSPVSALARLEAPSLRVNSMAPLAELLATVDRSADRARSIMILDREPNDTVLTCLPGLAERGLPISIRVRADRTHPGDYADLARRGARVVFFDVDRVEGATPLPGSSASAQDLRRHVDSARSAGLAVGAAVAVGLPGESRRQAADRTEALRGLGLDRAAVFPFEPTMGTPAHAWIADRGWLPKPREPWIREVHRPLIQPSATDTEFWWSWQEALEWMAEVETRPRQ